MDLNTVILYNRPRPLTDDELRRDIGVARLELLKHGATVTIAPIDGDRDGQVAITVTAADGHTTTRTCLPWYQHVLSAMEWAVRAETLIVCGTHRPETPGRRHRPRAHTCGIARPRREMTWLSGDGVWRCPDCDARRRTQERAVADARNARRRAATAAGTGRGRER